jgi:hypothetical protein
MSLPDEVDLLVVQLAASLEPAQHHAFLAAARTALAGIPCLGPGSAYRVLAQLQRGFWDPPLDRVAYGPSHHKTNKLNSLPAIETDSARGRAQARTRWMRGWRG